MGQRQRTSGLSEREREVKQILERAFPRLRGSGYKLTSKDTPSYNCIAWAAGDNRRWWWPLNPDGFWPDGVPRTVTMNAFVQAYETVGFVPCRDSRLDRGFEKIALYADADGVPKHAARQLPNGKWTSKLGPSVDIEHTLIALQGQAYGQISIFLRRPVDGNVPGTQPSDDSPPDNASSATP